MWWFIGFVYCPLTVLWHWAESKLKWYPVLFGNYSHHEQSKSYPLTKALSCSIHICPSSWCVGALGSTNLRLKKAVAACQGRVPLGYWDLCLCFCCHDMPSAVPMKSTEHDFLQSSLSIFEREVEMMFRITALKFDGCSVITFQILRTFWY